MLAQGRGELLHKGGVMVKCKDCRHRRAAAPGGFLPPDYRRCLYKGGLFTLAGVGRYDGLYTLPGFGCTAGERDEQADDE